MDLSIKQSIIADSQQDASTVEIDNPPKRPLLIHFLVAMLIVLTGLAGYLYFKHFMPMKMNRLPSPTVIPSPSPSPSPSPTLISTSGWKTYSNAKMGVAFRYPEETSPLNMKNGVIGFFEESSIREKCKTELDQKISPSKSACFLSKFSLNGLQQFTQAEYEKYQTQNEPLVDPRTFIDKQNRVWQTDQLLGEVYNFSAVTLLDNQEYVINFQSRNDLRNIFDQILSTVQFFEKNQTISTTDRAYEVTTTFSSKETFDKLVTTYGYPTMINYLSTIFGIDPESIKAITYDSTNKNNGPYNEKEIIKVFQIIVQAKQPILLDAYTNMDQKITTKQLPANQLAYLLDPKYCQTDEDCLIRSNFCRLGGFNKYHASVDVWGCGPPDYEVKPNEFESIEESIQNDQTCGTPTADFTNATCVNNTCQANGFITCPNRSK